MTVLAQDRYTALSEFVEEYRNRPFAWGDVDCMQITRAWVERATGVDPHPGIEPYTTALGAARVLRDLGYDSLEAALDDHFAPRDPAFAQRGDIASFQSTDSPDFPIAIGVCVGADSAFPSENGLLFNPTSQCRNFWKIN